MSIQSFRDTFKGNLPYVVILGLTAIDCAKENATFVLLDEDTPNYSCPVCAHQIPQELKSVEEAIKRGLATLKEDQALYVIKQKGTAGVYKVYKMKPSAIDPEVCARCKRGAAWLKIDGIKV